jgi:hypothetical protein
VRVGSDRFSVGDQVFDRWFPDEVPRIRGWRVGDEVAALVAAEGPPARREDALAEWVFAVDDPGGNERRVVLWAQLIKDRVVTLHARFTSRDRMDVDAAWRPIKDHLDKLHGQPAKQVSGLLKLVWTVADEPNPTVISGCRFREDSGLQVLDVVQTLKDGARLHVGGRSGPTSPPAGGRPPPRAPGA